MDTTNLKRFAVRSRQVLRQGVAKQLRTLGFDAEGQIEPELLPLRIEGGYSWRNNIYDTPYYRKWVHLLHAIKHKGLDFVYEEAAYAWFNRLVAIRVLEENGLLNRRVLTPVDDIRTPQILQDAQLGEMPPLNDTEIEIMDLLLDTNSDRPRQFAILINAWCHDNPIVSGCFGGVADFTELLVPFDIMEKENFLDMLHNTPYITKEDYRNPELIGWLYQFYISEKKDEVFAKKGKFEADDIPAATQIFTPNWIVRYLTQNTVGRIYLDNHPEASHLADKWSYLTPVSQPNSEERPIYKIEKLQKLRMADMACGSGHILNEGFDIYMDLYKEEYVSRPKAVELILRNNLVGIDIDDRARQLAMFALTLKACQHAPGFEKRFVAPNVMSMPQPFDEELYGKRDWVLRHFFQGLLEENTMEEVTAAYDLMQEAKSLGSIMKISVSHMTRLIIKEALEYWQSCKEVPEAIAMQFMHMRVILALSDNYSVMVANPPYMGRGHMPEVLAKYLDKHYSNTKQDMFATFMQMMMERTQENGYSGFITMESWMFLSSFEKFRKDIIENYYISSLGHFGWHIMGIAFGTAMTVIQKAKAVCRSGEYSYLTIDDVNPETNTPYVFPKKDNGRYAITQQAYFEKIPGSPIGYWVNEMVFKDYSYPASSSLIQLKTGITTADNNRFTRLWMEINKNSDKWVLLRSGAAFRKWYGYLLDVVLWEDNGREIKNMRGSSLRNMEYQFKPCATWSKISSGKISIRYSPQRALFDAVGLCAFADEETLYYFMALVNSVVGNYFLRISNPSMSVLTTDLGKIPFIERVPESITKSVKANISISKLDWDSHETSWDFQTNELVTMAASYRDAHPEVEEFVPRKYTDFNLMEYCYQQYVQHWTDLFHQLHANEEQLNKQFIEIYGLQDELTPDVPLNEVTILQQGEISLVDGELVFHADVIVKQFISYLVGVCFGRYRLDKPGLHIAHPKPAAEELAPYTYRGQEITIVEQPILPILPQRASFVDNLPKRINQLLAAIFGVNQQPSALRFINQQLGKNLDEYLGKDFWKDHKKMYKNRPIYWFFTSDRGHFRCLTYMHRMNEYTAFKVYQDYLVKYIGELRHDNELTEELNSELGVVERRRMQFNNRAIADCEHYSFRLIKVAEDLDRTKFDLDDGFVKNYAKYGDAVAKV